MERYQHSYHPLSGDNAREIPRLATAPQGFLCYCGADLSSARRLQTHLSGCQSRLDLWDEARLPAGALWRSELTSALARASFAVLLVSPDFLAAPFITSDVLPPLLRAARTGGTRIVSVITRPCVFEASLLADFQPFNSPARPLSGLSPCARDQFWVTLIRSLLHTRQ